MLNLYLHIPFCRSRCRYCDFFLVTRRDLVDRFFKALGEETLAKAQHLEHRPIGAIHFGGGTPSLVPVNLLAGWLEEIQRIGSLDANAEITLEANPEDLDLKTLKDLRAAGINRLSIGVQSFIDRKLHALGRAHNESDAARTVHDALRLFDNVSVDLMCGAEGERMEEWEADIRRTLSFGLHHVSVYMLNLEEKTMLWRDVQSGLATLPGEEVQAAMYEGASAMLRAAGYLHYEVSNFALPGFHSRYNLDCWLRKPYLGFGPSAHSFLVGEGEETRFSNARSLVRYLETPGSAADFHETLTERQRFDEEVFLSLRINSGLDVEFLRKGHKLGQQLTESLNGFEERGLIRITDGVVRLTEKGILFADLIASELLSD